MTREFWGWVAVFSVVGWWLTPWIAGLYYLGRCKRDAWKDDAIRWSATVRKTVSAYKTGRLS